VVSSPSSLTPPVPPLSRAGLRGHIYLTCSVDATGRSYLSRQSFNAPFHLSKPYWDGRTLTVQMVNPTAGILSGDRLCSEVKVEPGARLNLTTPSAARVYTMPEGRAEAVQDFSVARDGRLCFVPSMLVPHKHSRYHQTSRLTIERGGELLYLDTLAPGRVAHGESFQYTELKYELELCWDGHLNARECFRLRPDDTSLTPLRRLFPHAYWASGYLIIDRLTDSHPAIAAIRELHCSDVFVGLSRLPYAGWNIKIIARDSCALNRTFISFRHILSNSLQFAAGLTRA